MASLLRFCEACLLCAVGSFMLVLASSSEYWRFIHPKYAWISFTAGAAITILGGASLFNRRKQAKASELAALLLFCVIAFAATNLPTPFMGGIPDNAALDDLGPDEPPLSFTGLPEPAPEDLAPRLTIKGKEYVKINEAELIFLDGEHRAKPGDGFAIQGSVVRTKELDKAGVIAVARLFISCCFADATATAYLVKVDAPEAFANGQWVRAAGRIQPTTEALKHITLPVPGAITTVIGENYLLHADDVRPSPPTGLPFLFEMKPQEPYAY